ncbi:hypothetical protein BCR34DRAFT_598983 [Clohesyomyces aquaticus]|uniref:N-acetyltransferase domain-containing protein n=1 Tax=Clohesyomyces aquaticus TaxID=1231657 RepID=A0A1Y1ZWR9_9PLEO|nr:hypothetical protein BCR34DRAFT_598983 [Clohesyomyces aquaticus]
MATSTILTSTNMTNAKRRRFDKGEVVISPVTEADLLSLAEGYYASFPDSWFDKIEPPHLRTTTSAMTPPQRFAERMKPWLLEPHTRWMKATLALTSPEFDARNPKKVIGHAGWLLPERTSTQILNFWRKDAARKLAWHERMSWTSDFEEELWRGVDEFEYNSEEKGFLMWDNIREGLLGGVGHWHLAPLWVLPEHQGRGVASMLLQDAIAIADQSDPPPPMYLEAMPAARPIYAHFGYEGVKGPGEKAVMIRNPPKGVETMEEEEWRERIGGSFKL